VKGHHFIPSYSIGAQTTIHCTAPELTNIKTVALEFDATMRSLPAPICPHNSAQQCLQNLANPDHSKLEPRNEAQLEVI